MHDPNRTDAALAVMRESLSSEVIQLADGIQAITLPNGRSITSLKKLRDEYLAAPERRIGTLRASDVPSFIGLVNRYRNAQTLILGNPNQDKPSWIAVLDAHPSGAAHTDAGWGQFRCVVEPVLSPEWKAWAQHDDKLMGQVEFAEHIEEHILDVAEPRADEEEGKLTRELIQRLQIRPTTAERLLGVSRGMRINEAAEIAQAINLASGETEVSFKSAHVDTDGKPVVVPQMFLLQIPVFEGGPQYRIPVRLYYRRVERGLKWGYRRQRADLMVRDALADQRALIEAQTEVPLFLGAY